MQIWLGKQLLGGRSFKGEEKNHVNRVIPPLIISVDWGDDPGEGEAQKGSN